MLKKRKILIVEDEVMIAMDIEAGLSSYGANVIAICSSVNAGLKIGIASEIDAAILDVDLGGQHVYPIADILKNRGIPFVFHTGNTSQDLRSRYPDAPILQKPVGMKRIAESLSNLFH